MTTFKVPDSADEAVEQLGSLGRRVHTLTRLLSAREWERAAIIACLVGPERGKGRPPKSLTIETFPYSTVTLSELGVYGMRSSNTVAKYRNIWCRERAVPDFGDEISLDDLPEWTGEVRSRVTGTGLPAAPAPEEPEPVVGMGVDEDAVNRAAGWQARESEEEEGPRTYEPDPVTVHMQSIDSAHNLIDRALILLRDARRARDEDYPHLNTMQLYAVRGWLSQIRGLVDELQPVIEEENRDDSATGTGGARRLTVAGHDGPVDREDTGQ